ncbi:MAG TPA: molybdenum cofactor biosynthesis protein MoaE [Gemmatimonadaceae bacterium]|nr:molybdenum cofactor biosynthesis protein MoaE [Gemmatimonadaceae bacterium]
MRAAIVHAPIDAAAVLAEVASDGSGASVLFVGTVREFNDGRAVTGIDYTAYEAMAGREMEAIVAEAAERFETPHVVVEHRLGTLAVREASVVIAVSHARRAPAMDAARYVIEQLKARVPIWKREHYADGTREWVDPTAHGDGSAARGSGVGAGASHPHIQSHTPTTAPRPDVVAGSARSGT